MATKLLWTGLTCLLALPAFFDKLGVELNTSFLIVIGIILMTVGCIMLWLNR